MLMDNLYVLLESVQFVLLELPTDDFGKRFFLGDWTERGDERKKVVTKI